MGRRASHDVESVIVATGSISDSGSAIKLRISAAGRLFVSQSTSTDDSSEPEQQLRGGWQQIVAIYASLMGRSGLDLYRPKRV